MAKISGPYTIPDEHTALIGRVAEAWAQLEFHIDYGIWHLANTHQQLAACITAQFQAVHPRLRAFIALVQIRNGSQATVDKLNSFQGNVSGLVEKRNRCVHDPRFKNKRTGEISRLQITAKPKVEFDFLPEPANQLQATIDQIYERTTEFIRLRNKAIREIDALPLESQPTLTEISPVPQAPPTPTSDA